MLVAAQIAEDPAGNRRQARRHRSNELARIRQFRQPPEMIHVTDISIDGCGFRARCSLPEGTRLLLNLPGLEVWLATVAWFEDGRGGLKFDRPLHPAVARRFAVPPDQSSR